MKSIIIMIVCFGMCFLIEHVYNSYLDSLSKDKRDELIKRQREMRCPHCGSTEFEVVSMRFGRVKFQCRHCKKIR